MRMSIPVILMALILGFFIVFESGSRQSSTAQSLLGEWQIIETEDLGDSATAEWFERGTYYKFGSDQKFQKFSQTEDKRQGQWQFSAEFQKLSYSFENLRLQMYVDIIDDEMIWQVEHADLSRFGTVTVKLVQVKS